MLHCNTKLMQFFFLLLIAVAPVLSLSQLSTQVLNLFDDIETKIYGDAGLNTCSCNEVDTMLNLQRQVASALGDLQSIAESVPLEDELDAAITQASLLLYAYTNTAKSECSCDSDLNSFYIDINMDFQNLQTQIPVKRLYTGSVDDTECENYKDGDIVKVPSNYEGYDVVISGEVCFQKGIKVDLSEANKVKNEIQIGSPDNALCLSNDVSVSDLITILNIFDQGCNTDYYIESEGDFGQQETLNLHLENTCFDNGLDIHFPSNNDRTYVSQKCLSKDATYKFTLPQWYLNYKFPECPECPTCPSTASDHLQALQGKITC